MAFQIIEDFSAFERDRGQKVVLLDNGEFHGVEYPEEWDVESEAEDPHDLEYLERRSKELVPITPSSFTEFAVRMPDKEAQTLVPFSFKDRNYLRQIYDTPSKRTLLKCGRQVEKSQYIHTLNLLANGKWVEAGEVSLGDELVTMAPDGSHMTTGKVTWVSRRYSKTCVRIKTRQGHEVTVALTHPMRCWDRWVEAGELQVGQRLAAVRRGGEFTDKIKMSEERIRLTAYLIGDGHIGNYLSFTTVPGPTLDEFISDVLSVGGSVHQDAPRSKAVTLRLHKSIVRDWMSEDGLLGTRSGTKFIPSWVFDLNKEDTALFLNRLWSTDGHVKKNSKSKYSIEYCSISRGLIKEVQALLWKFGIPSRIRKNWPNYWKKRGVEKYAYILRVETQEGVRRFLADVGALGKSEGIPLPDAKTNNNRDTYPVEINALIGQVIDSRGSDSRFGCQADTEKSLRTSGLRETLKYAPTKDKLELYVAFFRSDERYDQKLVDELEKHIDTDLYWDEIVEITPIGEQECVDFEVEGTHNFVAEGLITHNSTLLGNKLLSYSCINTSLSSLYVSPTNQQTKVFSQDRLKEPVETSDFLKSWTTTKLSDNVFLKKFINRSQITLRYAYLNADRVRGIPADIICLDELQDLLTDTIPVIEECASHSPFKIFMYSGTPKSLDNTLEYYWATYSTQNEWAVPCHRHSIQTPGGITKQHWNILSEEHIGKEFLICDKCKKQIHAGDDLAQWVALNPDIIKQIPKPYEGFRIPQLMVPWISHEDLVQKQKTYSRPKFYNEVLGLSYDSGTRPLTRQDVIDNCDSTILLTQAYQDRIAAHVGDAYPVYAGIDWGSGENTYTSLSLGTYLNSKFTVFYFHRFEGVETDPKLQIEEISRLIQRYKVQLVGCDYGGGFWPNDELTRRFGMSRIVKYQYSTPSQKVKWEDGLKRFLVHRTEVMSDVFNALKRRDVFRLPNWEQFQIPYGADFLNIFSEYNEQIRQNVYKKAPNCTDDSFHSMLYCFLASMIRHPRPDVIAPHLSPTTTPQG